MRLIAALLLAALAPAAEDWRPATDKVAHALGGWVVQDLGERTLARVAPELSPWQRRGLALLGTAAVGVGWEYAQPHIGTVSAGVEWADAGCTVLGGALRAGSDVVVELLPRRDGAAVALRWRH